MQRAHPGLPIGGPAHRFRPGKLRDRGGDRGGRGGRRGDAWNAPQEDPGLALAVAARLAIGQGPALAQLAQEALDRLVGRADARTLDLLGAIRRGHRQTVDDQREAPWRREGARRAPGQPGPLEPVADQPKQILGGASLHARGDLLGKEFDQQFSHWRAPGS